jgi:hypothetical protein
VQNVALPKVTRLHRLRFLTVVLNRACDMSHVACRMEQKS